jgi:hypothetical protein
VTQVIQSIKNVGLLLLGVVMIVTGYRVNDTRRQAQAELEAANARALEIAEQARAQEAVDKARAAEQATQKKPKTTVEKAKPEMASATQQDEAPKQKKGSAAKSNATKRQKSFDTR